MQKHDVLTITPVDHPDVRVRRVGFDLTDPYVEQCWGSVIGPSATVLLRRLPTLWIDRVPATITHEDLARTLGLGAGSGAGSRLTRSIDRVAHFGLANWNEARGLLDVHLRVPALTTHQLERLPEWTQRAHGRLLDAHVQQLAEPTATGTSLADVTARLDRLEQPRRTPSRTVGR